MAFKDVIAIVFVGLFAIALLQFGFQTAINNESNSTLLDNPALSGINASINDELDDLQSGSQTQRESFEEQGAEGGADDGFGLTTIVSITRKFFSTAMDTFNIIFALLYEVLGIPPLVTNIVLGFIIIVSLILIWRVIKAGGT